MKTLKLICALIVAVAFNYKAQAQSTVVDKIADQKSYWQISARGGYDFPLFKEDFQYIDYKGGLMGGLSINHYWKWIGVQADFDYIQNKPITNIGSTTNYYTDGPNGVSTYPLDVITQRTKLTRMFTGIGPAFKLQSKNNKLTAELALMGGMGFIDGGEILVEGKNSTLTPQNVVLTYHSGFDHEKVLTGKAQARFNYFFTNNLGVNVGAYYMNHFGVNESKKNQLLIDNGYLVNNTNAGYYYGAMGTIENPNINKGEPTFSNFKTESILRSYDGQGTDQREKIKLSSLGVFAGLTYRIMPRKQKPIVESTTVTTKPIAQKYNLQIIARDKFTKELLPNTDVALKNSKGEVLKTGKTDAFGAVAFNGILADDYSIAGILNTVALDGASAQSTDFKYGPTLQKEILYTDRNFIVTGKVFMCNTTTFLTGTNVILENNDKAFRKSTVSDTTGNFKFQLPEAGVYKLYSKKDNFFSQIEEITASNYNRDKSLFVKLEICAEETDCDKAINLKNILFDLDKFVIREDAKKELNKLVRFMQDNPLVKVELGSHTDSRGSAKYNQSLSQKRANASVAYIVSEGIDKSRITGNGYGESKLLNECADSVQCSEAQHQLNRRTEFKVICPK